MHVACRPRACLAAGLVLVLTVLAGCASNPTSVGAVSATSALPALPAAGATIYHVVPSLSQLRIRVYRGGVLGDLGHNHVLVTSVIKGDIYLHATLRASGFQLTIPLKSLQVDPVKARRQEGAKFAGKVTDDDRASTRKNMRDPAVLDVAKFPAMTLRSVHVKGPPWYPRITVRVTLHGVSHDYVVPVAIVRGNGGLVATGGLTVRQTDFGIKPFSVLAGALQVKNALRVSFHLVATP